MQQTMQEPLWDESISAYLLAEYEKVNAPLTMVQLREISMDNAWRIGDILETLFLMTIYGEWAYTDDAGKVKELNEDALNELYAKGRLTDDDLGAFPGIWKPA